MKRTTAISNFVFGTCLVQCSLLMMTVSAQDPDSTIILTSGSSVRGQLTNVNADGFTVETSRGPREVLVGEIRQVKLGSEPSWLTNAKTRYRESRFDACYEAIARNELEGDDKLVQQEIAFFEAMSAAQLSLTGGDVSTNDAIKLLVAFVDGNPDSFNRYPAIEMVADLGVEIGRFANAVEYYEQLQNSKSEEFKERSKLKLGKAKLYAGDYDGAKTALAEVEENAKDEQSKLIASCLLAQTMSYQGQADQAITQLNKIIKEQSSSQSDLFARAYNALGICHLNKDDLKAARTAFMHTQLLFFNDRDAHAESLYHLHQIATKLKDSERTAQTRQLLKSRYRNTHWAAKL